MKFCLIIDVLLKMKKEIQCDRNPKMDLRSCNLKTTSLQRGGKDTRGSPGSCPRRMTRFWERTMRLMRPVSPLSLHLIVITLSPLRIFQFWISFWAAFQPIWGRPNLLLFFRERFADSGGRRFRDSGLFWWVFCFCSSYFLVIVIAQMKLTTNYTH